MYVGANGNLPITLNGIWKRDEYIRPVNGKQSTNIYFAVRMRFFNLLKNSGVMPK